MKHAPRRVLEKDRLKGYIFPKKKVKRIYSIKEPLVDMTLMKTGCRTNMKPLNRELYRGRTNFGLWRVPVQSTTYCCHTNEKVKFGMQLLISVQWVM
jgi:hypothetical protein